MKKIVANKINGSSTTTTGDTSATVSINGRVFIPKTKRKRQDIENDSFETDSISMSPNEETPLRNTRDEYHREYSKTLLAIFAVFVTTTIGAFIIAYIHKFSVREQTSLPDIVFNMVPEQKWAWQVSDVCVIVCPLFGFSVLLFHKHYTIVFRRLCAMAAFLYFLRGVFLLCTYLPPPFADFKQRCFPANFSDNAVDLFVNAFNLVFKAGFTYNETRFTCGDTIFSGHAMVFTLICLVIRYYTPRPLQPYPAILVILGAALGVTCVLISRQHYTVDVAVALLATVAVFYGHEGWTHKARDRSCFSLRPPRFRPVLWLFVVLERRTPPGPLPAELAWPLPWPGAAVRAFQRWNERNGCSTSANAAVDRTSTVDGNRQPQFGGV